MWKIGLIALLVIFLIGDSIYLYFRLKKYWSGAWSRRSGQDARKWKIGLSSLDIPLANKPDDDSRQAGDDRQPPTG